MKTTTTNRVEMKQKQHGHHGDQPDYSITIDGKPFATIHYNTRGYTGHLPCPPAAGSLNVGKLQHGENNITKVQMILKGLQKEWREWFAANPGTAIFWNAIQFGNLTPQSTIA